MAHYSPGIQSHSSVSFLEGPASALIASKDFENGHYKSTPQHGIRAFGRVYSAWVYSQAVSLLLPEDTSLLNTISSGIGNIITSTRACES
jgi:hypothetical protein